MKQTEKKFHVQAKELELLLEGEKKLKSSKIKAEKHQKLKKPSMFQA